MKCSGVFFTGVGVMITLSVIDLQTFLEAK